MCTTFTVTISKMKIILLFNDHVFVKLYHIKLTPHGKTNAILFFFKKYSFPDFSLQK
jgi:hypothetical protein